MASPIITPMPVQTDTNYRPMSRMAVIGLILALPSTLIFASESLSWMLLVITIPAIILCVLAWRNIRGSQGNLAGEALAILGLVISVGSGLGWLTMTTVSKYVTESEARTACDDWLAKMQRGEAGTAFLMQVAPAEDDSISIPKSIIVFENSFPVSRRTSANLITSLSKKCVDSYFDMATRWKLRMSALSTRKLCEIRYPFVFDITLKARAV